jgi:hypothetical protein
MLGRRQLAIVEAAVLATGLGVGAAVTLATGNPSRAEPASGYQTQCPHDDRHPETSEGEAAKATLVPRGARGVLLCRYHGLNTRYEAGTLAYSRPVTKGKRVDRLAGELNALRPLGPGPIACPADFGANVMAFFHYTKAPDDAVSVELSGCSLVSNGQISRSAMQRPGPKLLRQVERLTHCKEKIVCQRAR